MGANGFSCSEKLIPYEHDVLSGPYYIIYYCMYLDLTHVILYNVCTLSYIILYAMYYSYPIKPIELKQHQLHSVSMNAVCEQYIGPHIISSHVWPLAAQQHLETL